jgi:hypothetical protein
MRHRLQVVRYPLLGKLNAVAVFLAWGCLGSFLLLAGYAKLAAEPNRPAVIALGAVAAAFVPRAIVHLVLCSWVRCPHCGKLLTAQGFSKPRYGEWSTPVINWFSGAVKCIHCGRKVATRKR